MKTREKSLNASSGLLEDKILENIKVLDLSTEEGFFCGKLLGDMGADVVKVEPPDGDPARKKGPFYKDIIDPKKSLYWFALNNNKRGITLDITSNQGGEILKKLIKWADVVIQTPVINEGRGYNYKDLRDLKQGIISVSITPFGSKGPYKDFKTSELMSIGMCGWLYLCGDTDRQPVQISCPQAYYNAGMDGAVGAMLALYDREITGNGQEVEISIQRSLVICSFQSIPYYEVGHSIPKREGPYRILAGYIKQRQSWPCKDGFISFSLIGGGAGEKTMSGLVGWMQEEGMSNEFIEKIEWKGLDLARTDRNFMAQIEQALEQFFLTHTMAELYEGSLKRRIMLYPVSNTREIYENKQLLERDFWEDVKHPELKDPISYPGPFGKFTETPLEISRPAPLPGQHNEEIYIKELGFTLNDLELFKKNRII